MQSYKLPGAWTSKTLPKGFAQLSKAINCGALLEWGSDVVVHRAFERGWLMTVCHRCGAFISNGDLEGGVSRGMHEAKDSSRGRTGDPPCRTNHADDNATSIRESAHARAYLGHA